MRKTGTRKLESTLLAIGLTLLAVFLGFRIYSVVASRAAINRFAALTTQASQRVAASALSDPGNVDFSLWDEKRIAAYRESLEAAMDDPIAVLIIPKLSLEVPVFNGTDDLVLNRGAGRIIGTARPGQSGNMGIAGHRDGFFRGLKDLQIGDRIELTTLNGKSSYVVDKFDIVDPDDVSVLEPRERPALTLVTCYPFYFVGHAPQRYIVRALVEQPDLPGNRKPNSEVNKTDKQEVTK
jgi:sortase A